MAILRKPYEISVWEDVFDNNTKTYLENRIAVIGSDTMTSPNKAFSPVLTKNMNGEITFTFSMAYRYFDPASNTEIINPFVGYLINERKIKLYYDDEWYDLIIVDHQEDSDSMVWQYTAKDAFVNELSKNGYAIEFSTELGNNQGTAVELAKATVKNTDWTVDEEGSDLLVQKVHEPMIRAKVTEGTLAALKVGTEGTVDITSEDGELYIFYSYIANQEVKFVQFMRSTDKADFIYDDNNTIIGTNYRIEENVRYTLNAEEQITGFTVESAAVNFVLSSEGSEGTFTYDGPQYTVNQGYRIVYGPLTTYDPVMERTVERYQTTDSREVYKYSDSEYVTSNVVMSYVTNGSDFNIYNNGTIQGWSNAVATTKKDPEDATKYSFQHLGLTSYPEIGTGVKLVPLTELTRVEGFLELKFDNPLNSDYENAFFNSGFMDNAGFINHIAGGEEFVFRIACAKASEKHGNLTPLNNPPIHALVAKYTEPLGKQGYLNKTYYKKIDKNEIYLDFNGSWTKDNPTITGGTFSTTTTTNEETGVETEEVDYKNYIIDGVIQEPTTNSVYKVDGSDIEYVWSVEKVKYIPKSESNFIDYYYTTAKAIKPLTNTALTDPSILIGIFLYTDTNELCAENVYTYISNIQLTRCVRDKAGNPVTIGNVPTTTIVETPTYYLKPNEGATKEKVDVYYDLAGVARSIGLEETDITPVYNKDSEKILSISEAQSNCFNILQTICETFECWLKLDVQHDEKGAVIPGTKKIQLKEFAGKNNFAGFKYGINVKSIQRTLNSEEIVTKLIVDNVQSDYVDEGVMSIRNAVANPSGEANIINFNYYVNKGLIKNIQGYQADLNEYYTQMKKYNTDLNELNFQKAKLELALTKIEYNRNVYTELIDAAVDKHAQALVDFKEATGLDYNEYVEKYGSVETIVTVAPVKMSDIGKIIPIPTHSLIPASSAVERITPKAYGFGLVTSSNEDVPYYADKYMVEPLGEEGGEISYISRIFTYENNAWTCKQVWTFDAEDTLPPENDLGNTWRIIIAEDSEADHGASALLGVTTTAKLVNYGYAFVDDKNYLAVQLVDANDSTHYHYRLYRWNDTTASWESIYDGDKKPSASDTPAYNIEWDHAWGNRGKSRKGATTLNNGELADHEAIIDIVADLYVASSTINNYAGILTNINKEYDEKRLELYGAQDYDVAVSSTTVENEFGTYRYSRLILSDYIDGNDRFKFYFLKNSGDPDDRVEYESSVSSKVFEVYVPYVDENSKWYNCAVVTNIPEHYSLLDGEDEAGTQLFISPNSTVHYTLAADSDYKEAHPGYAERIKEKQDAKDAYEKSFYSRYSRFIKEGTWSSNDYIDANLYYLDALQASANSAMPKVEYSIEVAEVSELEGLENYIFDVGDKTYIEDTEFFGWNRFYIKKDTREISYTIPESLTDYEICNQPAREEIIVSQVEWHLDEPETNVITVQNYKTRFEDLFQRLSATVQTVQYNESTYAKTSSFINDDGTINQNVLLSSLNRMNSANYMLTSDGSIVIDRDKIVIRDLQNLTKSQNIVKIDSRGISISNDAGDTWTTALDGTGLNAGIVTSGELNTRQITIVDGDKPTFRWDRYGISAYKRNNNDVVDLNTFVRFDQFGLYGIQRGEQYKAQSLADVKRDAQFGITWDGFFIKNSYEGGGLVQITSDNDFQVINSAQTEKIKIGALEWTNNGVVTTTPVDGLAPSLYGIRINNDAGETVFKTGDDGNITITGTINATGGNFSDLVTVGKNQPNLPYIAIDGTNASMYSSNYEEGAGYGWMINKDGDAVFNNITARGAIKTAVFEYAEIQAVGGVFIFRPSSTIRSAAVDGNNLVLTVEKPVLFKDGQWCKVSNYTADGEAENPDSSDILNNGLTHIYQVQRTQGSNEIILLGAAAMVEGQNAVVDSVSELIGGALVDMGNKAGTSNYGIGINSSDNTVNLPARAISLFETQVDETQNPKVTYKYRGILGTLPQLPATSVNTDIYRNMVGTQGIYTDNMYLGDLQQYLAFYTDENGNKKLKISAAQISFEIPDEHGQGSGHYQDVADIEAEGVPGPPGEDAITVQIDSSAGNLFYRQNVSSTLTCTVYSGTEDITNQVTKFTWKKKNSDGTIDPTWTRLQGGRTISINPNDVESKAIFICEVEF